MAARPRSNDQKWFDTKYRYMVPELTAGRKLALNRAKAVDEYREAKALGYETRPVLLSLVAGSASPSAAARSAHRASSTPCLPRRPRACCSRSA